MVVLDNEFGQAESELFTWVTRSCLGPTYIFAVLVRVISPSMDPKFHTILKF